MQNYLQEFAPETPVYNKVTRLHTGFIQAYYGIKIRIILISRNKSILKFGMSDDIESSHFK